MEKVLQNLRVRLKFRIRQAMKIKNFVAREIQYFEIEIFSFNSYVYYLTRGFIVPTRAFNLLSRAFNLANRSFSLLTRGFEPVTCGFEFITRELELVTRGFELVTRELELVTCRFELVTCGFQLVTCNSCFTFQHCHRMGKSKKIFQNRSKNLAEYNTLQQAITEVSDLTYEKKND